MNDIYDKEMLLVIIYSIINNISNILSRNK